MQALCRTAASPMCCATRPATWMVQRSVPFEMVAKFLGNSKEMVERVYGHHSLEWSRLTANTLSRQVAEKTETPSR
jgi:hypothetical protein